MASEPAGWLEAPHGKWRANPLYRITFPQSTTVWAVPLYMHPPQQRRPLTDDEIAEISIELAASHRHFDSQFARAIELAHGIGGDE